MLEGHDANEILARFELLTRNELRRAGWPVTDSFLQTLRMELLSPTAERLVREGESEEQIAGTERKLRLVLSELRQEAKQEIERGDAREVVGAELASSALNVVLARLCPLWPVC